MNKKLATIGLLCALVTACGGDGGDAPAPAPAPTPAPSPAPGPAPAPTPAPAPAPALAPTPEGLWEGRASTGVDVALTVLENGETWGVYASGGYIVGALFGDTTARGNQLSGSGVDFNLLSRTVQPGSYTGSFTARSSINVQLSAGATFTGSYNAAYDQPASATNLAGSFTGEAVTGLTAPQAVSITVSAAGVITMPASQGCSAAGTARPRATGKNVFDVSVTFQGNGCALGHGTTARGVAYYDTAQRRLLVLALNNARTDGFIYVAVK